MTRRLLVWWPDRPDEILGELEWREGRVTIVRATSSDLRSSFERVLDRGLDEWVGPREAPAPRHTDPASRDFLPRLGEHVRRQTGFAFEIVDQELTVTLPNPGVALASDPEKIRQNARGLQARALEAERERARA